MKGSLARAYDVLVLSRRTLLMIAASVATALALSLVQAPPLARAETTGIAVIACENIAAYLDGDPNNGTPPAEEDMACLDVIPPTGQVSIASLASAVGNGDSILEESDLTDLDLLDHNRISPSCTYQAVVVGGTKPAMGCTLLVFGFVDDETTVTLDLDAGLTSIEAGGAANDYVCDTDGVSMGQDADCSDALVFNESDGVVVFRVLVLDAALGAERSVRVRQEDVEHDSTIVLSEDTRFDADGPLDPDVDGVPEPMDNCPEIANADQLNTDNAPIVTGGIGPADHTIPVGDSFGDACDGDDDNDGIPDDAEPLLAVPVSPPIGLQCPGATGGTDPLLADTDGDRVVDSAECVLGSNPLSAASTPAEPQFDADGDGLADAFESGRGFSSTDSDSDDDGIGDGVEFRGYNTSPIAVDTDGDGCPDGLEITSLDTNQAVNSNDLLIVALSFNSTTRPNIDIDKNGMVNSSDLLTVALNYGLLCNLPD